jgi:hypothetical protein
MMSDIKVFVAIWEHDTCLMDVRAFNTCACANEWRDQIVGENWEDHIGTPIPDDLHEAAEEYFEETRQRFRVKECEVEAGDDVVASAIIALQFASNDLARRGVSTSRLEMKLAELAEAFDIAEQAIIERQTARKVKSAQPTA